MAPEPRSAPAGAPPAEGASPPGAAAPGALAPGAAAPGALAPGALLLGIDVGGTKAALGLVDGATGQIVARRTLATPPRDQTGGAWLQALADAALAMLSAAAQGPPAAIGVGLCELVTSDGQVDSSHRILWAGLDVGGVLAQRLAPDAAVVVESDVRAAALAEARLGAGAAWASFLYLNIGTGLSACWVAGGRPHAGTHGHGVVLATQPSTVHCPRCGAVSQYVLEDLASGGGLHATADWWARAAAGPGPERAAVVRAADLIATALGPVLGVLDPPALVVGGGLGAASGPLWEQLVPAIRAHLWSPRTRALAIVQAGLGADAGLIGAALAGGSGQALAQPILTPRAGATPA